MLQSAANQSSASAARGVRPSFSSGSVEEKSGLNSSFAWRVERLGRASIAQSPAIALGMEDRLAAEMVEFNDAGLIVRIRPHYAAADLRPKMRVGR